MSGYSPVTSSEDDISTFKDDQTERGNLLERDQTHQINQRSTWSYDRRKPLVYVFILTFMVLIGLNIILATSLYFKTRNLDNKYGKSHRKVYIYITIIPPKANAISRSHRDNLSDNR